MKILTIVALQFDLSVLPRNEFSQEGVIFKQAKDCESCSVLKRVFFKGPGE